MKKHIFLLIYCLILATGCATQQQSRPAAMNRPGQATISRPAQHNLGDAINMPLNNLVSPQGYWQKTSIAMGPRINTPLPNLMPTHLWGKVVHKVEPGQSLYGLSRLYFNDIKYWQQLAQSNPQAVDANKHLILGTEIYIDADKITNAVAVRLYIAKRGDDWSSLARLFLGRPEAASVLSQLNSSDSRAVVPGTLIKIRP